jgi:hypothetical protein
MVGLDVDEAAGRVAVRYLGWDEERAAHEVQDFRSFVKRFKPKALREELVR